MLKLNDAPVCADCRHCSGAASGIVDRLIDRLVGTPRIPICVHPRSPRDIVTGQNLSCDLMRRWEACGMSAVLFESR